MARTDLKWLLGVMALLGGAGCGAEGMAEGEPVAEAEELLDMSRFKGWKPVLPIGVFLGPPAVVNVDGNLNAVDIYGQGTDKAIWYARRTGPLTPWVGWTRIPGAVESKPAATMFGTNRALVATRDDGNVWITSADASATTIKAWE
jgi:hypothetical protein